MRQPRFFHKAHPTFTAKNAKEASPLLGTQNETLSTPIVETHASHQPDSLHPLVLESTKHTHTRGIISFACGILLLGSLFGLGFYSYRTSHAKISLTPSTHATSDLILGTRDGTGTGLHYDLKLADARADIVASFLTRYKSPLKPYDHYGKVLVDTADRYNLDYRLLPAIMMQESNLCKASDPSIHNCLGFGIHERGTLAFDSYEESFDRAARELKERYIDIGLTTPEEIMTKYTPSSNGSWANSVNQWIAEMEHNSREQGIASTTNADLTAYNKP